MCYVRFPLLLALVLMPALVLAGSYTASPVKLYLDQHDRSSTVTIRNDGKEKITVQAEVMTWSQDETGKDVYAETEDILLFPGMIRLEPGDEQVLRIGLQGVEGSDQEQTYRLFLQELPVSKPGEMGMRFALQMNLPIFIAPAKQQHAPLFEAGEIKSGHAVVTLKNNGNTHFIPKKILVRGLDAEGVKVLTAESSGWYVLPGVSKAFVVGLPEEGCKLARAIEVDVEVDQQHLQHSFQADGSQCIKPEAPDKGQRFKAKSTDDSKNQ